MLKFVLPVLAFGLRFYLSFIRQAVICFEQAAICFKTKAKNVAQTSYLQLMRMFREAGEACATSLPRNLHFN